MRVVRSLATAIAAAALAACVSSPAPPAPAPVPAPVPRPVPPPAPAPAPLPVDWQDAPASPGDWSFGQSPGPRAAFGAEQPLFVIACTSAREIAFFRFGAVAASRLTVRTSFGERSLTAASDGAATIAMLPPADPLLDAIAFSRGRFLVRVDGQPDLLLPAWPEPARVIEECRQ